MINKSEFGVSQVCVTRANIRKGAKSILSKEDLH